MLMRIPLNENEKFYCLLSVYRTEAEMETSITHTEYMAELLSPLMTNRELHHKQSFKSFVCFTQDVILKFVFTIIAVWAGCRRFTKWNVVNNLKSFVTHKAPTSSGKWADFPPRIILMRLQLFHIASDYYHNSSNFVMLICNAKQIEFNRWEWKLLKDVSRDMMASCKCGRFYSITISSTSVSTALQIEFRCWNCVGLREIKMMNENNSSQLQQQQQTQLLERK